MKTFVSLSLAGFMLSSTAHAQTCSTYVGQTVAPKTFEQAITGLGNVAPKGEFETTAQYQARISGGVSGGPLIIAKKPEDPKYFQYDADSQVLNVVSYAFHNSNMNWWGAFYDAKPAGIKASTINNHAIVISQADKPAGTYSAQNAYGASATITKIDRTTYSIFEKEAPVLDRGLFVDDKNGTIGSIPMDVATAQAVKPTLKIAFVVAPKAPYLVEGSQSVGKTTISNPVEITEHFKVMIADLQCGLLTDSTNKVLAAYAMK